MRRIVCHRLNSLAVTGLSLFPLSRGRYHSRRNAIAVSEIGRVIASRELLVVLYRHEGSIQVHPEGLKFALCKISVFVAPVLCWQRLCCHPENFLLCEDLCDDLISQRVFPDWRMDSPSAMHRGGMQADDGGKAQSK